MDNRDRRIVRMNALTNAINLEGQAKTLEGIIQTAKEFERYIIEGIEI